jgi:Ca2+-binding RTX toxin-like protein
VDQLKVDGDRVGGELQAGRLKSYQFVLGAVAQDSSDRLMYDRTTGHLWFDRDGTGNSNAILLVTFANQSQLNASDLNYSTTGIR